MLNSYNMSNKYYIHTKIMIIGKITQKKLCNVTNNHFYSGLKQYKKIYFENKLSLHILDIADNVMRKLNFDYILYVFDDCLNILKFAKQ